MPSRVVASQHTSIGTPVKKKNGKTRPANARRGKGGGHQDARSILIAAFVALILATVVVAIWVHVKPFQIAASEPGPRPPPTAADLEAKKTHSYWKVGSTTYRHYITDTSTGEIVDAGTVTVKEMLDQGIEVPGYILPGKNNGSNNASELAARFQAIQDHLK